MSIKSELENKKLSELKSVAAELGITLAKRDRTKKQVIAKIVKFKVEQNTAAELSKSVDTGVVDLPDRPDFVAMCKDPNQEQSIPMLELQPPDGRGGVRENAGRPPGMTDEKARVNRLLENQIADPNIVYGYKMLFGFWAKRSGIKEIALDKDEAELLALPTTNIINYHFPGLKLPPVMQMYLGLAIAAQTVIGSRMELVENKKKTVKPTDDKAQVKNE